MGDQHQCRAGIVTKGQQQIDDVLPGPEVEIAGGFVGEQDRRPRCEGPCDGDPLLFAAGQLTREMLGAFGESNAVERLGGDPVRILRATEFEWQEHIFERRERRQELKILEDEADTSAAQRGALVFIEVIDSLATQPDLAGAGRVEAGEQPEQGRFARTRRAEDRDRLTGLYGQIAAVKYGQASARTVNILAQSNGPRYDRAECF